MRYVVIAMLIAIVASLGSALWAMLKPGKDPKRMVKALAVRVGRVAPKDLDALRGAAQVADAPGLRQFDVAIVGGEHGCLR